MDPLKQNLLNRYTNRKSKVQPAVHVHPIVVILAYLVLVFLNAYSGIKYKELCFTTPYKTWLQPDDISFSIWGVIYTLQFVFAFAQYFIPHIRNDERVILARPAYVVQCLLNGGWLIATAEANLKGLSSFWMAVFILLLNVLFLYLGAYVYVAQESNPYRAIVEDEGEEQEQQQQVGGIFSSIKKLQYRWFVWYPISTNMAWIFFALIIDWASTVEDLEYVKAHPTAIGGPDFAIGVAFFAALVAAFNGVTKQDFGYVAVTIWGLWGIYRYQHNADSKFPYEKSETLAGVASISIYIALGGLVLGWILDFFGAIPSTRGTLADEEILDGRRSKNAVFSA